MLAQQAPSWCWCCWSGDKTMRNTTLLCSPYRTLSNKFSLHCLHLPPLSHPQPLLWYLASFGWYHGNPLAVCSCFLYSTHFLPENTGRLSKTIHHMSGKPKILCLGDTGKFISKVSELGSWIPQAVSLNKLAVFYSTLKQLSSLGVEGE